MRTIDDNPTTPASGIDGVSVRLATPIDAAAVERVAQRDSRKAPRAPLLVAEVGEEIVAARSLGDGEVVADPFSPTAAAVEMLATWAAHIEPRRRPARRRPAALAHWRRRGYAHA